MRYFLFVSILVFTSCKLTAYKNLKPIASVEKQMTTEDLAPKFDKVLYNAQVYGKMPLGKRFRLSGLLFMKSLEDSSVRVVFQNQMGVSFFDFGWDKEGAFTVFQIMDQMNKPALIKTLRKDFELLLFKNIAANPSGIFEDKNNRTFIKYELSKGFVFYIYNNGKLEKIENADKKRKVVLFDLDATEIENTLSSKIKIKHLRANFSIDLERIIQDEKENIDATTED